MLARFGAAGLLTDQQSTLSTQPCSSTYSAGSVTNEPAAGYKIHVIHF
jgi:hypothetical protein